MTTMEQRNVAWSSPSFESVVRLVGDRTGLVFSHARRPAVEAAIRREAQRLGCTMLAKYEQMLRADAGAVDTLAAELTIGETYFFRDTPQFDLMRMEILPHLLAPGDTVRVWSAACASGEEAYSLAILCHELGVARRARILGTDLSRDRLRAAREARYTRWSLRGVPDQVIATYFTRRDTRFDLAGTIREMVDFRYLNLGEIGQPGGPATPAQMDLILCRNVLMYFDAATTARVLRQLVGALSPRGWLLLGASDPPITDYVECEVIVTKAGLAYRPVAAPRFQPAEAPAPPAYVPLALAEAEPPRELLARAVEAHAHGRESEASALAGEFIELGGDELTAWIIRVRALADAGSLAAAEEACLSALAHYPLSAELFYLRALLLHQTARSAEAAESARRALYLDRSLAVAHLTLGDVLLRLGAARRPEAVRAYQAAQRILARMEPEAIVPASGGERSARLQAGVAARLQLMENAS